MSAKRINLAAAASAQPPATPVALSFLELANAYTARNFAAGLDTEHLQITVPVTKNGKPRVLFFTQRPLPLSNAYGRRALQANDWSSRD